MTNNQETFKLQELIIKEKEEKERAERTIMENRLSDRLKEKEIELAQALKQLECERNLKNAIEKENAEKDLHYARVLQENFDSQEIITDLLNIKL